MSGPSPKRRRLDSKWRRTETVMSEMETLRFLIDDFENIPQDGWTSPSQMVHGFTWILRSMPSDLSGTSSIRFYLICREASVTKPVHAIGGVQYGDRFSTEFNITFYGHFSTQIDGCLRNSLSSQLDNDGSLAVEIKIHVGKKRKWVWYPEADMQKNLFPEELFESADEADVWFSVGEERERFHCHRCVLVHRAPALYNFIRDVPQGNVFEIPDIASSIFKIILSYIYLGTLPSLDDVNVSHAKDMMVAADRFNLVTLKLQIESEIVAKLLTANNAAEWLSFADSHVCPMLKEESMDLYIEKENRAAMKASSGWAKIMDSPVLHTELSDYLADSLLEVTPTESNRYYYDMMTVGSLREKLAENNLDLDGTRAMLLQRLKDHQDAAETVSN